MSDGDFDEGEESGGGGLPTEMILSYLAFGKRSILKRKWLVLFIFSSLSALVVAIATVLPRTYHCEARLMAQRSQNLFVRGDDYNNDALKGAGDVVLRHENLTAIVKQTNLVKLNAERRPPIIKVRDNAMAAIRGPITEKDQIGALVWTLETKLTAAVENSALTIGADWYDPQTSADLVQAALDNFLETRHVAEISTGTEFISILEGHASRLRTEVETIAAQIRTLKDDKRKEKLARVKAAGGIEKPGAAVSSAPRRIAPVRRPGEDEETASLRASLEAKQRAYADLEDGRKRRLSELQSKLSDLLQKYTSAHPQVMDARQNIAALSQESSQASEVKAEIRNLESELKRKMVARDGAVGALAVGGSVTRDSAAPVEPLPSDIMSLLEDSEEDLDPAVSAQFRYAVDKYASIRGQISSARVDLDTAQAAFKYRYNIVVPPEVPTKPTKPKIPLIIGGGIFAALIVALLSALGLELKAGKIVETWQVQQMALPLLAELRFPPAPSSSTNQPPE